MTTMTPGQEAAAFHGLATNEALPTAERLALALQALDGYEAELERVQEIIRKNRDAHNRYVNAQGFVEDELRRTPDRLRAEIERLGQLVRDVTLTGTGFVWHPEGGTPVVLHPAEVVVFIAAGDLTEREQLYAEVERLTRIEQATRAYVDARHTDAADAAADKLRAALAAPAVKR